MKNFKYSTTQQEVEIESILKQRKRKIAKQQIIFSLILTCILAVVALYFVRKIVYTDFDGYIDTDFNDVRAMDDLFVMEVYKDIGDIVVPGDTLFSYVYLTKFKEQEYIGSEPDIISQNRHLWVQYNLARQDIDVLRVRITELKRQLVIENHNISFGLNNNEYKLKLEKELAEAKEELKVLQRKLRVLKQAAGETETTVKNSTINGQILRFEHVRQKEMMKNSRLLRYSVAADTSVVTKIWIPELVTVLKGENIIQTQSFDLHRNNLSVVGYVPTDQMHKITRNTQVEVIINDDISFSAHVDLLGTRTEVIPEALRNKLSKDYMAIVVNFSVDPDQILPFWALVKHVPVTIRIHNFRKENKTRPDYIPFNTSYGVITDSLNIFKK